MKTALTIALALLLAGCSSPPPNAPPVIVFAAASTAEALETFAENFRREKGIEVTCVFAGSATLARQIEAGAQADLFLSANDEWADYLARKGLVAERRELLGNRLVVVAPIGSKAVLGVPEDLSGPGVARIAVGDPDAVPAGTYARQALRKLGLWDRLGPRLVPAGDARRARGV